MNKRILMISNIFPPKFIGGYEINAYEVGKFLAGEGEQVRVLSSDFMVNSEGEEMLLPVSRALQGESKGLGSFTPKAHSELYNSWNIRQLANEIEQFKPEMVILWNLQDIGSFGLIKYLEFLKIPTLMYLMDNIFMDIDRDGDKFEELERIFGSFKIPENFKVIAMSERLVKEIAEKMKIELKGYKLLPGWVKGTVSKSEIDEGKRVVRDKSKDKVDISHYEDYIRLAGQVDEQGREKIRFVFSSRIAKHKGVFLIPEAVKILRERDYNNFVVDIYGLGEVLVLKDLIKDYEGYINYKGVYQKEEVLEVLAGYDALIFPTWEREAFGLVVIEGAHEGVIPLFTEGIGAGEWFKDDFLVMEQSAKSLSAAMERVLSLSRDELSFKKEEVKVLAQKNFNFDNVMIPFNSFIKENFRGSFKVEGREVFQIERAMAYLYGDLPVGELAYDRRELAEKFFKVYSMLPKTVQRLIVAIAKAL